MKKKESKRKTYHHGDLAEALLVATHKLVTKNGAAAFSLREAARAVGVDPAAVYRHYSNKDEILQAVARKGFTELQQRVKSKLAQSDGESIEEKINLMAEVYLKFALDKSSLFEVMFGSIGIDSRDPSLTGDYNVGDGPHGTLVQFVEAWLKEYKLQGDSREMALILWSSIHGLIVLFKDGAVRPESGNNDVILLIRKTLSILFLGFKAQKRN